MKFLGDGCASDDTPPFNNADGHARSGEISRTDEPVVTAANDDGIEVVEAPLWKPYGRWRVVEVHEARRGDPGIEQLRGSVVIASVSRSPVV